MQRHLRPQEHKEDISVRTISEVNPKTVGGMLLLVLSFRAALLLSPLDGITQPTEQESWDT